VRGKDGECYSGIRILGCCDDWDVVEKRIGELLKDDSRLGRGVGFAEDDYRVPILSQHCCLSLLNDGIISR
jgi:hypothetical protein